MSKRGEEENVPAEEDVNQRGGCEADLKEMTFKVSTQRQEDDWTWNAVQPWARPWQETDQERILDSSEAPADFFVYGRFLNWQTRFSEQRLSIRSRSLRPTVSHAQPRFSFSSGLRAPERKSSLEIVCVYEFMCECVLGLKREKAYFLCLWAYTTLHRVVFVYTYTEWSNHKRKLSWLTQQKCLQWWEFNSSDGTRKHWWIWLLNIPWPR